MNAPQFVYVQTGAVCSMSKATADLNGPTPWPSNVKSGARKCVDRCRENGWTDRSAYVNGCRFHSRHDRVLAVGRRGTDGDGVKC